jgi:hypothetical protein
MKALPIALFVLGTALLPKGLLAQEELRPDFDPAFVHVVYFWLHQPDDPDQREAFETALKAFLANSRYAKTRFIGRPPKATRDVVDDSFTYSMIVTFESAGAQAAYQEEQAHLDFIAGAGHLWKKVVVYDALGLDP